MYFSDSMVSVANPMDWGLIPKVPNYKNIKSFRIVDQQWRSPIFEENHSSTEAEGAYLGNLLELNGKSRHVEQRGV